MEVVKVDIEFWQRSAMKYLGENFTAFFEDRNVTEIWSNGDGKLWCSRRDGKGCVEDAISAEDIEGFLQVVASQIKMPLGKESLNIETRLEGIFGGARLSGQLPPLVERPSFNLRMHTMRSLTVSDLVGSGSVPKKIGSLLKEEVRRGKTMVVCGAVDTGKTTFLNALIKEIDSEERIGVIEDTREIEITSHEDVVCMTTTGNYRLADCIEASLRKSFDRIVVGEIRGKEGAYRMLEAFRLGMSGMGTFHAESAEVGLNRLVEMCHGIGEDPRSLIGYSLDYIIYLKASRSETGGKIRKLQSILSIRQDDELGYKTTPVYERDRVHREARLSTIN